MLEFFLEVVARFVGVTVVTLFRWCASGFKKNFRSEWRGCFKRNSKTYEWVDLLGVIVIIAVGAAIALVVVLLTGAQ